MGGGVYCFLKFYRHWWPAELRGLAEPTVRQWIRRGKFHDDEARKSAGTWLVTRDGMIRVAGEPKNEKAERSAFFARDSSRK